MNEYQIRTWPSLRLILWLGPPCAFAIAKLTAQQSDGLSIANTALILAFFSTAIGALNPMAGVFTSLSGGAFLNYFHTEPVHSFRMSSSSDILMISLFMVLSLSVSIVTSFRMRRNLITNRRDSVKYQQDAFTNNNVPPQLAPEFWQSLIERIDPNLSFIQVSFTNTPPQHIPTIARHRPTSADSPIVVIPECGASVEFLDPRISQVLILKPTPGFAPLTLSRAAIFALSNDAELSLQGTIEE